MRYRTRWLALILVAGVCVLPAMAAEETEDDEGVVRLDDIVAAMHVNHAAADERYVGKRLQIRGRVLRVQRFRNEKDGPAKYLVRLQGVDQTPSFGNEHGSFMAFVFAESERGGLADLTRGSMIVVQATCKDDDDAKPDATLQLRFDECKLMRIEKPPAAFLTPPTVGPGPTPPGFGVPMGASPFPDAPPMAIPPPRP